MSSAPSPAYNTLTLEQAYDRVRSWYRENVRNIKDFNPNKFALNESPLLVNNLPEKLSKLEMRAILHSVLDGILAWGKTGSDDNLGMEAYAVTGLDGSGGPFTLAERTELKKTSVLARWIREEFQPDADEGYSGRHRSFDDNRFYFGNVIPNMNHASGSAGVDGEGFSRSPLPGASARLATAPEPVSVPPTPKILSDQWVKQDFLGYQPYARTLASLISNPSTHPPLTIGLEAPWGAGKTSVMKMVQDMLDKDAAACTEENAAGSANRATQQPLTLKGILDFLKHPRQPDKVEPKQSDKGRSWNIDARVTVWFNAWKYQNSEQIWAGLAHCIIQQVTARMSLVQRESFWLGLNSRRVDPGKLRTEIYKFFLQRLLPKVWFWMVVLLGAGGYALAHGYELIFAQHFAFSRNDLPGLGAGLAAAWATYQTVRKWKDAQTSTPSEKGGDLLKLIREPDYDGKMGFLYLVESDVREVLDLVATKEKPLVIFIDDLDRCLPHKVAEVVEAISLFLAGDYPNCIFVLGMEPRMVAAALEVANKDLIARMAELGFGDESAPLGWRFMEKIIQLPLVLPGPTELGLGSYLNGMAPVREVSSPSANPDFELRSAGFAEALEKERNLHAVVNRTEELLATATDEDRPAIAEASKRVYCKKFDPQDPLVISFLGKAIPIFGANPRQMKRYVNMFRFCLNLRYALWLDGTPAVRATLPSDEAISKFVVMSVRWPQATALMRQPVEAINGQPGHKNMLECLEAFARKLRDESDNHDKHWDDYLNRHQLQLLSWAYCPSLRRHLGAGPSLAESTGKGLW